MKQEYHFNAVTNVHIRKQINESSLKNFELPNLLIPQLQALVNGKTEKILKTKVQDRIRFIMH